MRHWTTKYQMRFFIAVLQLSIILCYDTLKILKSGLDRGPIIIYRLIARKAFDEAEGKVKELENITDSANKDVLSAKILIKKGRLL